MTVSISGTNGVTFPDNSLQTAAASPFGLKNRLINADMRIDQRNAGASVTITTTGLDYAVDRFFAQGSVTSKFTAQRSSTAPTGFTNSLLFTSSAATTPSSSDYYYFSQRIEGTNTYDLDFGLSTAKTITISFWVRSSLTGTFSGVVLNSAVNRSYAFTYTISSANTWEQKSVTITGDTSGTWLTTTGVGLEVRFALGAGSSFLQSSGSWGTGNVVGATGTTQWISTNGATFYITGVQLEIGSTATPFERRMYGQELALCQRYFTLIASGDLKSTGVGYYYSATSAYGNFNLPVTMRTTPTIYQTTGTDYYRLYRNSNNDGVNSFTVGDGTTPQSLEFLNSSEASGTAGQAGFWRTGSASSYLAVQAEL